MHEGRLWLFDPANQKYLSTLEEATLAYQVTHQAHQEAEQRVVLLEAELARLWAQLPPDA